MKTVADLVQSVDALCDSQDIDWLDEDGYPTDAALDRIRSCRPEQSAAALDLVGRLWSYPNAVKITDGLCPTFNSRIRVVTLATGGWSGNESLIAALKENTALWMMCWRLSRRGGYFEFEIPESLLPEAEPAC